MPKKLDLTGEKYGNLTVIVRNSMESFMKPAQKMMKFADGTFFRKETGTASKDLVVDEEMAMI